MASLLRGSLLLSLGILLSRLLGYARDATVAYLFGASPLTDGFFVAFRLPNLFRRVLGEGALNAVFIPLYGEAMREGRERDFLREVFFLVLFLSASVSLLGSYFAEEVVSLLAPGLRGKESFEYAVFFTKYLFPYLFLVSLYALLGGVLMVRGRFFLPSFSQALFNFTFITVLLLFPKLGAYALVLGVLLGGVAQVLPNALLLLREGLFFLPKLSFSPSLLKFLRAMGITLLGFSAGQLSLLVDTFLASFLREGFISFLYYASRLYQLPVSLFSVGVGNALLAVSARSGKEEERFGEGLFLVWAFSLPSAAGLFLLSEEIVSLLYGRGAFGKEEVHYTAELLRLYALSVPFFSLQHLFKSFFYAKKRPEVPLKAAFLTVLGDALVASLSLFLLGLEHYSFPVGAFAGSLSGLVFLKKEAGLPLLPPGKVFLKLLLSTAAMAAVVYLSPQGSIRVFLIPLYASLYLFLLFVSGERRIFKAIRRAK